MPALYLLAFAGAVVAGATLVRCSGDAWVDSLMGAVVVAALASTAIALLQWLGLGSALYITPLAPGGRPYANFEQPNHLATLIGMGIAGVLRGYERRRMGALATAVGLGFLGFGLIMTQSRTGWLFVVVMICWWMAMRHRATLRPRPAAVVIGAATFAISVASWGWLNRALYLTTGVASDRLEAGTRIDHWVVLLDAISRAPWFGYGWSQVSIAQQATALFHPATHEMLQDSHNAIIDLCIWMGVPLALVMVGAVIWWLMHHVRRCRDPGNWALFLVVGAVLTHAMLEYPLDYTYFLLPLGLVMGTIEGAHDLTPVDRPVPRWKLGLPLAGLSVMLVWVGMECMTVEGTTRQLRFVVAGIGIDRVPTVAPPDVVLLDEPREIHRFWLTPVRVGLSDTELDWMRVVMQHNSAPSTMLRYALAAGLNGRAEESARTLALICKIYPKQRCDEGRDSWRDLKSQHRQLAPILFPSNER